MTSNHRPEGLERNTCLYASPALLLMVQKSGSPVEVGSLSHYLRGLIHPNGGCLGFLPSTVIT